MIVRTYDIIFIMSLTMVAYTNVQASYDDGYPIQMYIHIALNNIFVAFNLNANSYKMNFFLLFENFHSIQ